MKTYLLVHLSKALTVLLPILMQTPLPCPTNNLEPIGTNYGESRMHSGYSSKLSGGESSEIAFAYFLEAVGGISAVPFLYEYK